MTAVQVVALIAVALGGTAVVLAREPARQALVASVYGLALAVLFLAFQAPDVALSQVVVGAVALPAMIMYALRKIIRREQVDREER
jgi:energy-converting hydrogenase B subunit D